jgi:hypothetical protein
MRVAAQNLFNDLAYGEGYGFQQAAEKGIARGEKPEERPSGAEAHVDLIALAARLKSCPDTKLSKIPAELSFSAACKARTLHLE